jgi:hypothetical protein
VALEQVDRQRLADLRDFLRAADVPPMALGHAAAVLYASVIGLESLRLTTGMSMREPLMALAEQVLSQRAMR